MNNPFNLQHLPVAVKNLLIINVGLFILTYLLRSTKGIDLTDVLGLYFIKSEAFKPWQLITHMFMHDINGIGHIFFNMFGLLMFGAIMERLYGIKKFLFLYFSAGLAALVLHMGLQYYTVIDAAKELGLSLGQVNDLISSRFYEEDGNVMSSLSMTDEQKPSWRVLYGAFRGGMVGASGCLMGVLGAFAVVFPNAPLQFLFIPVPIKAKYMVAIFAVGSLFLAQANFSWDNVAHYAHLGGLAAGLGMAYYWKKKGNFGNGWNN